MLATKFGKPIRGWIEAPRGNAAYVRRRSRRACSVSKTDRIDLLFMHEPDPATPIEETLRALDDLHKAGKVRHIAASNFSGAELEKATATAAKIDVPGFVGAQDEYSLTARGIEVALYPTLEKLRLGLIPYFPLGGGALTGKYRKGRPLPEGARHSSSERANRFLDPHWETIEALAAFAEARGHSFWNSP